MVNLSYVCEKGQLPRQAGALMEPGSTRTDFEAQLAHACVFYERGRETKVSVKNISFKTRECYWYEAKHPHAWLSEVSISHPRTWHWDPWPIREAGLWKSRNLGIGFWQRACWHGDMPLQLSWTPMTWVCYWGEKLWHTSTHMCTYACMAWLYNMLKKKLGHWSIGEQSIYFGWNVLGNKYPRINCHNIEISCL